MNNNSSYIDISERKLLLRLLDITLIITGVFLASDYTSFSYIDSYNSSIISWLALLGFYFLFFGEVFQLYDLKISASRYKIIKNLFLASLITTFVFVLKPKIFINYKRTYLTSSNRLIRSTIDQNISYKKFSTPNSSPFKKLRSFIIEFKYGISLDSYLRGNLSNFPFRYSKSSKYVMCMLYNKNLYFN